MDCIKVYGKSKDAFGWPENSPEPPAPTKAQSEGSKGVAAGDNAETSPNAEEVQSTSPMSPPPDTCLSWTSECVVLQGVHILWGFDSPRGSYILEVSYSKGFMYCWGLVSYVKGFMYCWG